MAVGDIERIERVERRRKCRDFGGRGHSPYGVQHVIWSRDREQRRLLCRGADEGADRLVGPVREEHGPGLRVQCGDVADAIVLLVRTGELVASNAVLLVGAHRADERHARLGATAHDHAIDVERRRVVTHERPGLDQSRAARALRISLVGVRRAARRQIDLGARDVQKALRPAACERACFLRVDHVVRWGDHGRGIFGSRPQRGERANESRSRHREGRPEFRASVAAKPSRRTGSVCRRR
jgi:hypothetical protein